MNKIFKKGGRFILILCFFFLLVTTTLAQSDIPEFTIYVCPDELITEIHGADYGVSGVPSSPGSCSTYTFANHKDDPNKGNHNVYPTLDLITWKGDGNEPVLQVQWDAMFRGTTIVTFCYQKKKRTLPLLPCEFQDVKSLVKYRLIKEDVNPGGHVVGSSTVYSKNEYHEFSNIRYINENPDRPIYSVRYYSSPGSDLYWTKSYGEPFSITKSGYGVHEIPTKLYDGCKQYTGPTVYLELKPSCDGDNFESWNVTGNPPARRYNDDEYSVDDGEQYQFDINGVDDVFSHYNFSSPDVENIDLNSNSFLVNAEIGSYRILATKKDLRSGCPDIPPLQLFVNGSNVSIDKNCDIVLPDDIKKYTGIDIAPGDPILEHFALSVVTGQSIIVKPGVTLETGAELFLEPGDPVAETDLDKNFIQNTSYDEYGRIISQGRDYYDDRGRRTQSQVKNLEDEIIITTEIVNDVYGRPAITTLPAPTSALNYPIDDDGCISNDLTVNAAVLPFNYVGNFINGDGNEKYDFENFDINKESDPDPVADNVPGSLGWYYSLNNGNAGGSLADYNEPLVAASKYPYSRILYHHDGSGEIKTTSLPGDIYKAGSEYLGESHVTNVAISDYVYLDTYFDIRSNELNQTRISQDDYQGLLFKTIDVDGDGRANVIISDRAEKPMITIYYGDGIGGPPTSISAQFYDDQERLKVSLSPNGWEQNKNGVTWNNVDKITYKYNYLGWILSCEETDTGITHFLYREDGLLRFSQNSKQLKNNSFSYINYDNYDRIIESGEWASEDETFNFQTDLNDYLEEYYDSKKDRLTGWMGGLSGQSSEWTQTNYDIPDDLLVQETGLSDKIQANTANAISYTENQSCKTWFSYDERGRITWVIRMYHGFGAKLIEYMYGPAGEMQLIAYQAGQEDAFYQYYTHNKNGMLNKVFTATEQPTFDVFGDVENPEVFQQHAVYNYYLHGPLKRIELADKLQGIDFIYTIGGALKGINSGNPINDPGQDGILDNAGNRNGFKPDVFGMNLHYYDGDYTSNQLNSINILNTDVDEQYTGNLKAQNWFSPVDGGQMKSYAYEYDVRNQLISATWGSVEPIEDGNCMYIHATAPFGNAFEVSNLQYDLNGNIEKLKRNNELGNSIADFEYIYELNKNQLKFILEGEEAFRTYDYNEIGQMIAQEEGEKHMYIQYDVSGKVTGVFSELVDEMYSNPIVTFTYDDKGFRSSKISYNEQGNITKKQWYIRDASGTLLSVYDENVDNHIIEQVELPIYGLSRIGMYKPNEYFNNYLYEIQDHLGNVRAVIGEPVVLEYLATFESERSLKEKVYNPHDPNSNPANEGFFEDYHNEIPTSSFINHTPAIISEDGMEENIDDPNEVVRINNASSINASSNSIGAGLWLPVAPGDKLRMEVYVKYIAPENIQPEILPLLAGNLTNYFGLPNLPDGFNIFSVRDQPVVLNAATWNDVSDALPQAFLNYMLFDQNYMLQGFEVKQVTLAAKIPSDSPESHNHEKLELEVEVSKPGFIYIYVSNDDTENIEVFFDDLRIKHEMSDIVAGSDYYPYGLKMVERDIDREEFRYGYQGNFSEEIEETGWNSFDARMYDPVIGRWSIIDPSSQFSSSYVGMGNNPMLVVDRNGEIANWIIGGILGGVVSGVTAYATGARGWELAGQIVLGAGVGALTSGGSAISAASNGFVKIVGPVIVAGAESAVSQLMAIHAGRSKAEDFSYTDVATSAITAGFIDGKVGALIEKYGLNKVIRPLTEKELKDMTDLLSTKEHYRVIKSSLRQMMPNMVPTQKNLRRAAKSYIALQKEVIKTQQDYRNFAFEFTAVLRGKLTEYWIYSPAKDKAKKTFKIK